MEIIKDIQNGDSTWQTLTDARGEYYGERFHNDTTRRGGLLLREYLDEGWIRKPSCNSIAPSNKTIFINGDGSQSSDGKYIVEDEESLKDPEYLLKLHGYNPLEWNLISAKNSMWDTQIKNGSVEKLYSSRITAKPKLKLSLTFQDIDNYFNNKEWHTPITEKQCRNYANNDEFLEIDLADAHLGLLSHYKESGKNYNIKIAMERVNKCIDDIIERIGDNKYEKIYYCCLGDFLHTDSFNNTTFKGTPQSVDSRFHKIFDSAMDLQISIIERLAELSHVVIPYVAGNHDKTSGYTLIKGVEKAFRNCSNVTFDTRPIPRKIIKEGKVLIGLSHGNMCKKNVDNWLITEYKKEFADAIHVECHSGHFHSLKTIEDESKTIIHRTLPTICHHSSWEYEEGYPDGFKAVLSFVWNKNKGLRNIWVSNPNTL